MSTRRGAVATAALLILVFGSVPRAAAEERSLVTQAIVEAPVEQVWDAFTTAEGLRSWAVAFAHVELAVGGFIETSYDASAEPGDPANIRHEILSFEPQRMLSGTFRMPPTFPRAHEEGGHWTVTRFEPLGPERTRVTLTMLGWGEGPDWDAAYRFFQWGNALSFERLGEVFPLRLTTLRPEPAMRDVHAVREGDAQMEASAAWLSAASIGDGAGGDEDGVGALLKSLGGKWSTGHEGDEVGSELEVEPLGATVHVLSSWRGAGDERALDALAVFGWDGAVGGWTAWGFLEDGANLRGSLVRRGRELVVDGSATAPDGYVGRVRWTLSGVGADGLVLDTWRAAKDAHGDLVTSAAYDRRSAPKKDETP